MSITFIVLITLPFKSFAEWEYVANRAGNTFYVDLDRITKKDDIVHYWSALNLGPGNELYKNGFRSVLSRDMGDCSVKKYKRLQIHYYENFDLKGKAKIIDREAERDDWRYALPDSPIEMILNLVCSR
tara:strand:- start:324 stop:707 length:384 start_codon:yes stop_codon:yes gene_type:complete